MPFYPIRFVCFARSCIGTGFSLSGKECTGDKAGPWIRLISRRQGADLPYSTLRYSSGETIEVLDQVSTTKIRRGRVNYPTDTLLVSPQYRLQREGRLSWFDLSRWLDHPRTLWENGDSSRDGCNDRSPVRQPSPLLSLIRVDYLELSVSKMSADQLSIRGRFAYQGVVYDLAVTDCWLHEGLRYADQTHFTLAKPVLCVSLDERVNGYGCKQIDSVLFPMRFA